MLIADNIIRRKLQGVFFLIGDSCAGKTTAARILCQKYGAYRYDSDAMRSAHFALAQPEYQPCMTRPDAANLTAQQAVAWEEDIVREFTPMMLADLMVLAGRYPAVVCDGDIDRALLFSVAQPSRVFYLAVAPDLAAQTFFNRPDHAHLLGDLYARADLTPEQKRQEEARLREIAAGGRKGNKAVIPQQVLDFGAGVYTRVCGGAVEQMMAEVERHFNIPAWLAARG
ncbi:MAG TPA: AAA family ATPase [Candidatus Gallacutalibacter stercoravium]|nr:AAA family ATPase [Candidatus Gallacutalibacter stercoravium]